MAGINKTAFPSRVGKIWLGVKQVLGLACVLVLFALIGLICADVVARYVINSPIRGAFELTEILLATLIFLALPLTTQAGEHIEVELIEGLKSKLLNSVAAVVSVLCTTGVFLVLAVELWQHAARLAERGQVTNSLELPISMIGYLAAASCASSALLLMLTATRRL